MKTIAHGCAPMMKPWPISALPKKTGLFWRKSARFCARWSPDIAHAIVMRTHYAKRRPHAGFDRAKARHLPQAARERLLRAAQSVGCRQLAGAAAPRRQGAGLDQRRL